jgi:ABC-type nitrate/sulfonate/bicarbonate transport system ATPase subunit
MSAPLIVAENLRKEYPGRTTRSAPVIALESINMHVAEHEVVCIVGPSGCGKSTLLNLLAGFEQPTAGLLAVRGAQISGPSPDRGLVFQQPALFPWLTVHENIALGPRARGMDREKLKNAIERALRSVGLAQFASHYPYQLSGGMRQRVQIARVLVASPDVMLMDEPFGALDAQTRLVMHEILLLIWTEYQPTIVFITHDVEEALFLADRVYVMSHRPGTMLSEIRVPFEKPRRFEITVQPLFNQLKTEVVGLLRQEWERSELALISAGQS